MKAKIQNMIQKIRSFVIHQTCGLMNLTSKICYKDPDHPIGWRDHLRWWLEVKLGIVFVWAYAGSDEEIEAVFNSEIPLEHMNARQRAVLVEPREHYGAHCCHCSWDGYWNQCHGAHECPQCGKGIYLDAFN